MTRRIVTIDGIDGSGKSVFAAAFAAECRRRAIGVAVFSVDDFRQRLDWRRPAVTEADLYYADYYDFGALERCLRQFLAGADRVTMPAYDSIRECAIGTQDIELAGAELAIVEGVFPLRAPSAAAGYLCYLRASPAQAHRRIVERDMRKGRSREEVERRIRERYFPSQQRYAAEYAPEERADLLIDNDDYRAPRVARGYGDRFDEICTAAMAQSARNAPLS